MTVFIKHAGEIKSIDETLKSNIAFEVILIHSFLLGIHILNLIVSKSNN